MKNERLLINVTSLANWFESPVGITRVQQEIFFNARMNKDVVIKFIVFNKNKEYIATVSQNYILFHLFFLKVLNNQIRYECLRVPLKRAYRVLTRFLLNKCLCRKSIYKFFKSNDTLVSGGYDWDEIDFSALNKAKKRFGFRLVCISYDIIPITHSQFVSSIAYIEKFRKYIEEMKLSSDKVICISNYVRNTLINFGNFNDSSTITVIPLASYKPIIPSKSFGKSVCGFSISTSYIIYITSLDIRKNHNVLLEAYNEAKNKGISLPRMLFVGKLGNAAKDILEKIDSYSLDESITVISSANDEEVSVLLSGSLFSVYPSFVEGWGLGATEAIMHGKACLISTADSLMEATNNAMPALDPRNHIEWLDEIHRMYNDLTYRSLIESRLSNARSFRNWGDFTSEVIEFSIEKEVC